MTESDNKGVRPIHIVLVAAIALVVLLALVSLALRIWASGLPGQIGVLQLENTNLQVENANLQAEIIDLQSQISSLSEPRLHKVGIKWTDHQQPATPYIHIEGCIFNSGSETANNVLVTVRIYNASDALLKSHEINLGEIAGKTCKPIETDIRYAGDAFYVLTHLTKA